MNRLQHNLARNLLGLACWLIASYLSTAAAQEIDATQQAELEAFFEKQVRPILMSKCSECHGAEKQESDLRVDSLASLKQGGASGDPAVVPFQPGESLLIQVVTGEGDYEMPPDEPLSDEEIRALKLWVKSGAHWPANAEIASPLSAADRVELQRSEHWSLQPLARFIPQTDAADRWSQGPIDSWTFQQLAEQGLQPSEHIDRPALIRRIKYSLLGLPPTYEEVQEFVQDSRPDAVSRLVDRYLASPAYGERWGRHWLDVARYADTRGYAFNRDRRYPYAYTYRDYVIQAFNDDLPYDRFVLEQLAADQIDLQGEKWRLAALGFLTVGRKFNNPHDDIDDKIDVVTRGLLGLTVACARCHDHKYDAIPTEDYYSLYGVFANSVEPGELPLIADQDAIERNRPWFEQLDKLKQDIEDYTDQRHAEAIEHARTRVYDYLVAAVYNLPEEAKSPHPPIELTTTQIKTQLRDRWRRLIDQGKSSDAPLSKIWKELLDIPEPEFSSLAETKRQEWLKSSELDKSPRLRQALSDAPLNERSDVLRMYARLFEQAVSDFESLDQEGAAEVEATERAEIQGLANAIVGPQGIGNFDRSKTRDFLNRADRDHLAKLNSKITAHQASAPAELGRAMVVQDRDRILDPVVFQRGNPARRGDKVPRQFVGVVAGTDRQAFENGSGRLDLARAIIDSKNPLTSRIIVNRVWMHHFRDPLVSTPSDFGIRCEEPPQRNLLDRLADELQSHDWSLKELHREIVLSSSYQQSSQPRSDAMAVDPENRLLWRQNRRRLGFEATRDSLLAASQQLVDQRGGKPVDIFNDTKSSRRSVYAYIDRQDLPNLLRSFDFASPDQHAPTRPRTIVPQQALFLMNSEFVRQRAFEIVERLHLDEQTEVNEGIRMLYRQILARDPVAAESDALRRLVEASPAGAWEQVAQVLMETNEFVFVD